MPNLDFTDIIEDPDLADSFDVIRRPETVGADGRVQIQEIPFPGRLGSVVPGDPHEVMRNDDGAMTGLGISVISRFRFRGETQGFQPDVIIHHGIRFTVKKVVPWTHYGKGFVLAVAESQSASHPAP